MGNVHLYADHIEPIRAQLVLEPRPFPTLHIAEKRPDIGDYSVADFVVAGYESHETIKFEMHA
jgi:thymidylate synthase